MCSLVIGKHVYPKVRFWDIDAIVPKAAVFEFTQDQPKVYHCMLSDEFKVEIAQSQSPSSPFFNLDVPLPRQDILGSFTLSTTDTLQPGGSCDFLQLSPRMERNSDGPCRGRRGRRGRGNHLCHTHSTRQAQEDFSEHDTTKACPQSPLTSSPPKDTNTFPLQERQKNGNSGGSGTGPAAVGRRIQGVSDDSNGVDLRGTYTPVLSKDLKPQFPSIVATKYLVKCTPLIILFLNTPQQLRKYFTRSDPFACSLFVKPGNASSSSSSSSPPQPYSHQPSQPPTYKTLNSDISGSPLHLINENTNKIMLASSETQDSPEGTLAIETECTNNVPIGDNKRQLPPPLPQKIQNEQQEEEQQLRVPQSDELNGKAPLTNTEPNNQSELRTEKTNLLHLTQVTNGDNATAAQENRLLTQSCPEQDFIKLDTSDPSAGPLLLPSFFSGPTKKGPEKGSPRRNIVDNLFAKNAGSQVPTLPHLSSFFVPLTNISTNNNNISTPCKGQSSFVSLCSTKGPSIADTMKNRSIADLLSNNFGRTAATTNPPMNGHNAICPGTLTLPALSGVQPHGTGNGDTVNDLKAGGCINFGLVAEGPLQKKRKTEIKSLLENTKPCCQRITKFVIQNDIHKNTEPGVHPCEWEECTMKFKTVNELTDHLQLYHMSTKIEYTCRWRGCARNGRPFANHSGLFRHLRYHTGDKPCKCYYEGCNFSSVDNGELKRHMKLVHHI